MDAALTKPVAEVDAALQGIESIFNNNDGVHLPSVLSTIDDPVVQAGVTHNLATCTTALVALYLRLSGVDIRSHRISTELAALKALSAKLPTQVARPKVDGADVANRIMQHYTGNKGS